MEGGRFPLPILKTEKKYLILENIALFVYIYGLNSHFKCSLKSILKIKTRQFSPEGSFFYMSFMKCLLKCTYSKKPVLLRKTPNCMPVTFNLTFHPNFHPNILDFANLPIYRKSIHYDKKRVLKTKNLFLVLF